MIYNVLFCMEIIICTIGFVKLVTTKLQNKIVFENDKVLEILGGYGVQDVN